MIYINKFIKIIKLCVYIILLLYFYRKFSYFFGRNTFSLFKIEINNFNLVNVRKIRIFYQFFIDFCFVLFVIFLIKINQNKLSSVNYQYVIILISLPLLTDFSDLILDKSCWKPWISYNEFIWYFPLRLVIWLLTYFFIKNEFNKVYKLSFLITLIISVLFYTFIKPY